MLPIHEPLIAQLLGAIPADAITSGCKVAALGPGDTYPSNVVYYANNLNIPAQVLTLLAGQGYSVDGTGCVLKNGTPAVNAPLVAYEPGDTNASAPTYAPTLHSCIGIASLGLAYPQSASGAQVLYPVIPGSTAGNCSVTVTASPAPSNASGLGSGVVPVQVLSVCSVVIPCYAVFTYQFPGSPPMCISSQHCGGGMNPMVTQTQYKSLDHGLTWTQVQQVSTQGTAGITMQVNASCYVKPPELNDGNPINLDTPPPGSATPTPSPQPPVIIGWTPPLTTAPVPCATP